MIYLLTYISAKYILAIFIYIYTCMKLRTYVSNIIYLIGYIAIMEYIMMRFAKKQTNKLTIATVANR